MATAQIPATSFAKRKSLRDRLDRVQTLDDAARDRERFELMEELEQDLGEAKHFRWHAPATQKRQVSSIADHHLEMYKKFVFDWLKGTDPSGLSSDEQDLLLFPDDEDELANQLNMFVTYVFKRALPRARVAESIHIRTLVQYRDSMLFWSARHYHDRGKDFSRRRIFNEMVRAMRYVQHKYGDALLRKEKTWLGLAELRQLLDFEMLNNRCIELSEQHQVLWCLGRITALRPGSLCPSGKYGRTRPLTWRDFQFTTGDTPGKFNVRLTLDHIDIKESADTVARGEAPIEHKATIKMQAPEPHNLVFSPAHRLLVIALHRGILQGINTLNELLDWDREQVTISPTYVDDAVFLAGVPKGTALNYEKAMQAHAMTEYLQRRGYQVGYTSPITWYSIRRRAATDMASRIGLQATRLFMGHSPESQTLERYYLNMVDTLDNMGVLTDQGISIGGNAPGSTSHWAPLALGKLDEAGMQRSRGLALSQMTRRLILADPEPPENPTSSELKNYRRRARHFAMQHLVNTENEWQKQHISKQDMDQRRSALNASVFADEVLRRALDSMPNVDRSNWTQSVGPNDDTDVPEDQVDDAGDIFIDQEDSENPSPQGEEDLETALQREAEFDKDGALELPIGNEADLEAEGSGDLQDVTYAELARSFMELLLDNTMTRHTTWSKQDKTCPLCRDDDTVDVSLQTKEYGQADKLDAHLSGHFHHPVSKWKRRAEINNQRDNGRYICLYCHDSNLPTGKGFRSVPELMRHIVDSSRSTTNQHHDELKANEGWYDDMFASALNLGPTARSMEKYMARGARNLLNIGGDTSPKRQLLHPEPYRNSDSIVRGSHDPHGTLSSRYEPFLQASSLEEAHTGQSFAEIPAHLTDYIGVGYDLSLRTNPLPTYMRDNVVVTRHPRSQEKTEEMEE